MAKNPEVISTAAKETLTPPAEFPFPFTPYSIQHEFMEALYHALENGKLGIFESPTGTGKSLSLICGALCWLRDHEVQEREYLERTFKELQITAERGESDGLSEPFSWLNEQAEQVQARQRKIETKHALDALLAHNEKISKIKLASKQRKDKRHHMQELSQEHYSEGTASKKSDYSKNRDTSTLKDPDDDYELVLDDIDEKCADDLSDGEGETEEEESNRTKIYFCSRTHSQLAQFIGEVQRSPFRNDISLVPLASRQNYCINEAVQRLKNVTLINEKCLDLQRKKDSKITAVSGDGTVTKKARNAKGSCSCPALNQRNIDLLSEDIIAEVQDVEQLVAAGKKLNACPYYSSRTAVSNAQVVVLPYNTLLHKSTRQACGIRITNSIVIIDEAHNLLEAIGNIHSAQVNGHQLTHAHSQLVQYRDRYETRFSASNLLHLNQVIFVVGKLIKVLGGKPGCDPSECILKVLDCKLHTLPDFVLSAEIDNLNLFKLLDFCHHSKLSQKLHGFSERYQPTVQIHKPATKVGGIRAFLKEIENADKNTTAIKDDEVMKTPEVLKDKSNNPFLNVMAFVETLTNDSADGRILVKVETTVGKGYLKFLLLNPAAHFRDIVREARAVIVAGGTMQPISEFRDQLFVSAGGDLERITYFSCDHVIPPENILPIAVGCGPTGKQLDFSYSERNSSAVINELGRLLVNICNVVPAGVVCFFPSYEYEKHVFECFEKSGIIPQLQNKKKIFREPKKASDVDAVLLNYASCIQRSQGGGSNKLSGSLLFSVIGGKLSEGLNFNDDLGRCIIVVGLPYPNIKSAELQEQMKYLDINVGSGAGQKHYENLCMKAVNQSIGRAVRHKDDYATVLLLDRRYLQSSRQNSLPNWMKKSVQSHERFGPAFRSLCQFFQKRKSEPKTSS